jgi:hypothetical protein
MCTAPGHKTTKIQNPKIKNENSGKLELNAFELKKCEKKPHCLNLIFSEIPGIAAVSDESFPSKLPSTPCFTLVDLSLLIWYNVRLRSLIVIIGHILNQEIVRASSCAPAYASICLLKSIITKLYFIKPELSIFISIKIEQKIKTKIIHQLHGLARILKIKKISGNPCNPWTNANVKNCMKENRKKLATGYTGYTEFFLFFLCALCALCG